MTQIDTEFSINFLVSTVQNILNNTSEMSALELIKKLTNVLNSEQNARKAFWLLLSAEHIQLTQDRRVILTPY